MLREVQPGSLCWAPALGLRPRMVAGSGRGTVRLSPAEPLPAVLCWEIGQALVKPWVSLTHCHEGCLWKLAQEGVGLLFLKVGRTLDFPLLEA